MNDTEVNVLLTEAAAVDPRMRRLDPMEAAHRAEAWATILDDVPLANALDAMRAHYRVSRDALMPADVLELAGVVSDPWAGVRDLDREAYLEQLEAAGVTEAEVEAHRGDRAWVEAKFGHAIEAGEVS